MEAVSCEAIVQFIAEYLISVGKRPASYNGAQAWKVFDTLARSLPLDDPRAVYFWYASIAEYSAFIDTYNARFIGY